MNNFFNKNLILDGAMGSLLLERSGVPIGYSLEKLNIENPQLVSEIHKEYVTADADVVYTNTFGANPYKFSSYLLPEIIENAITLAQGSGVKYVALDIGPLGKVIGTGGISFEDAISAFKEVVKAAADRTDYIVVETMTSLAELRAAILAVKETSKLPLAVSMSFNENLRTFFGTSVECFVATAESLGVNAIGANCSLGAVEMFGIAKELARTTTLPIFIKPNAGMPQLEHGKTVYDIDANGFCAAMEKIKALGINILGGCCGTTPEYIQKLAKAVFNKNFDRIIPKKECVICSATTAVEIDGLKVVGERINPTGKKRVQSAVREGDFDFLISEGVKQQSQGAHILDVNIGVSGIDEVTAMNKIVDLLQDVVPLPLQIDSAKPEVLESALRRYHGRAIVNSVNGSEKSLNAVLPIVKKYGAAVIGLTLDDNGIPQSADGRVEIAKRIICECEKIGIEKKDIFIDVLTMAEASGMGNALTTLNALSAVKKLGVKTALGISNVSFGMPNREDINAKFLELATARGLDLAIVNPAFIGLSGSCEAENFLLAKTGASDKYIALFTNTTATTNTTTNAETISLYDAIVTGQSGLCGNLAKTMLSHTAPLELAEKFIIPALDEVGKLYESGRLFLPQLIASAEAAKSAFFEVSNKLEDDGVKALDSLRFVLATVKGDIHDIGKNIVKTVVGNYGFKVIDLGRDVDYNVILKAVKENYPCVLGLSALMTTTAENMAETIRLVKNEFDIPILVGGAVITEEYAKLIGGIYCRDANATVAKLKAIAKSREGNI
ncbi:MAG TPA: homocysteine S-methyltransferase family protein [Clostridia bacterium]|nr:homocysteine S-methyltransferase family protein [Clostridia bacterium]